MSDTTRTQENTETRHVMIYGYTRRELQHIIRHFQKSLPDYMKLAITNNNRVTKVTLTACHPGIQMLRFKLNRYQQNLNEIFSEETFSNEDKTLAEVLGSLLLERELAVSSAESCTGGNIAHRIVQVPGSSDYFLGSVVSYSNDVKANVLGVSRSDIDNYGAVSKQVVEEMVRGVAQLMRTECAIATSGIAGPDGGTPYKPVGTVWIAAKCNDRVVSELIHFEGSRDEVIEQATNHGMFMLIQLLRNNYVMQEDYNDE